MGLWTYIDLAVWFTYETAPSTSTGAPPHSLPTPSRAQHLHLEPSLLPAPECEGIMEFQWTMFTKQLRKVCMGTAGAA